MTGMLGVSLYTEIVAAGVTARGVVSGEAKAQPLMLRLCPTGSAAALGCSWRVAFLALITGNGSGPDGNSLTVDYLRSKGSGAESAVGSPVPN